MIIKNIEWNLLQRELKSLRVREEVMLGVLDQIATTPRNRGARRLASSCVSFVRYALTVPLVAKP